MVGVFHFEPGYLFVKNSKGGADNVCVRDGTEQCTVYINNKIISLEQVVSLPNCSWRDSTNTSLSVDRHSGQFRLVQENCYPGDDVIIEGSCYFLQ